MADCRWTGNAQPVTQITTVAVSGLWTTGDTVAITAGGKSLVVTLGADTGNDDVVAAIVAAVNASSATDGLVNDETRNAGGQQIAELTEVTASGATSPVTFTARTAGNPFTIGVAVTAASTGNLGSPVEATAATGPHHAGNGANWSTGAAPADGDHVIIDGGDVDILYDLDQSDITPASITITQGYSGNIGLPVLNQDAPASPYREYRPLALMYGNNADAGNIAVDIGQGAGNGSGRIKLDFGDGRYTANIYNSGQRAEVDTPSILVAGSHASNELNVLKGDVGVAFFGGQTATLATVRTSFVENQAGDVALVLGEGVSLTALSASGGEVMLQSATTSLDIDGATVHVLGGTHAAVRVDAGSLFYRSTGTLTELHVSGGAVADFSRDARPRTVAAATLNARGTLRDPGSTVTFSSGVDLHRCRLSDVTLDLGPHINLQPAAI